MATSMMQSKTEGAGTYTYSSQPRAAPQQQKYRDKYGNACTNTRTQYSRTKSVCLCEHYCATAWSPGMIHTCNSGC